MYNIWLFPKWYPNREDPQSGVFIQKHARAIALKNNVIVLYIHSLPDLGQPMEIERMRKDNVEEVIVYFRKSTSSFKTVINLWRYLMAIQMGLTELLTVSPKPDIVHAYIMLRPAVIAWFVSWRRNIPFVISEQWSGYVTGKYHRRPVIVMWLTHWLIKKAAAVSSVSQFLLRGMKECGLSNVNSFVIPNCIEVTPATELVQSRDYVYVLIVADLIDEIKNISSVLRMIATLDEKISFRLHIIGHGRDEKMLKNLSSELQLDRKVFFEGLKPNQEVYQFLHRCDFLVMNSRYETFSLICAEAMSCGKPVLATRCGGPDEFVSEACGILIAPDNASELRSAFIHMLNNFQTFDKQKISSIASELFSQKVASSGFDNMYESVK